MTESGLYLFRASCAFLWLNPKKALDGGEDSGRGVGVGSGVVRLRGEPLPALSHDETEGFDQIRVRIEYALHRGVTDLKHLGLFECEDVGRPWFPRKERHFAEEIT